jgi:competence protein ComFC
MVNIRPCRIKGRWREGFALDFHTKKSVFMGYDEYGHPLFDTTYTEVGDLLYQLKYRGDLSKKDELVETIVNFIESWNPNIEIIVPVPPTRSHRPVQPVHLLSEAVGKKLGILIVPDCIRKVKKISELKDVYNFEERRKLLTDAYEVRSQLVASKVVLLFDDLYRSGATMNTIAELLYNEGKVAEVYALTVTRTRSRR